MNNRLLASELILEKFRSFENVTINLAKKITVISGVNGVGKSNILSLIASGSGTSRKSQVASNFQPEFTEFFNIDVNEPFKDYKIFIKYIKDDGNFAIARRLSFNNYTDDNRGIRIIPRAAKINNDGMTIKDVARVAKKQYGVGGSGRVKIPTIYSSLSRLYPLGERRESVKIRKIRRNNLFIQKNATDKYREWYNFVIPNSIKLEADASLVNKEACSRASLHMDIENTPTLSQSIGQDNVGNIISALTELYILSMEEDYQGAILCIDEIEVSLHPDTQVKMIDLLDRLADELKIQVVVSSHSLTVLKECLKKESKDEEKNYTVVYLKNPSTPMVTRIKDYNMLKEDMFGSLKFKQPYVKIYFEDIIGETIFEQLLNAYKEVLAKVKNSSQVNTLRNSDNGKKDKIDNDILSLEEVIEIKDKTKKIVTHLGCENLMDISEADEYFKRVIIMLDGDARIKKSEIKPRACEFMNCYFNPKERGINDRKHEQNIIFAPNYFAPESYLYRIIMKICNDSLAHQSFWRTLDEKESTALYTADKVKALFQDIGRDFSNDDLKRVFGDGNLESDAWEFVLKSDIIEYYYSDYNTVSELLKFMNDLKNAYMIAKPLTLSNRYV